MRLTGRVGRLERPGDITLLPPVGRRLAVRVAIEEGLDPVVVLAQAQELWAMAAAAGVLGSAAELARCVAAGSGHRPADVLAVAERRRAAWRG